MSYLKVLVFFLCIPLNALSQYYESGQDPAKVKWNQIKTENFQILFPAAFESEAQRLANAMELVYIYDTRTLGHTPKKISIILHNFSGIGNAFVGWAPKRSEFYTMPPQDIYPQDWLNQLALHEYRHVVQISKMKQGFTKILYFLLGEQAQAAIIGLYVPLWFIEGDAVVIETGLSNSGRGRLPDFEKEMRAQVLSQKIYSYEKAVFRSYKDFVPDHYRLGYLLVANGRKRHGAGMWNYTLTNVARKSYTPFPFSHGIKKASGMGKRKFYRSTLHELDSLWRLQERAHTYTSYQQVNHSLKKVYTNYRFPQWLDDSLIISQKFGMADIDQFVLLKSDGKEEKLFTPGFFSPVWLSAKKNLIVWSEYRFDKRWQNRIYNDILQYDVKTHRKKRLTQKRHLFAPALSHDASKVVAVEITPNNSYAFIILDAINGKELKKIVHPQNALLLTPTWSEDGNTIIACILTKEGKAIVRVSIETGEFELIVPFTFKEISHPVQSGNYIFFHGTYSGIDNIYAIDTGSKEVFQITSSRYGAFDPAVSPDGKRLLYADYTAMGFNVVQQIIQPEEWIPLKEVKDYSIKLYEVLAAQEGSALDFDSLPKVHHPVKRYRKFTHLLNLHSWSPFNITANNISLDPQITLMSQNKLSTMTVVAGYDFNYNEKVGSLITNISYKAWYPVLSFSSRTGGRASYTLVNGDRQFYSWHENSFALGISQPLNFTRSKYSRSVTPSVKLNYRNVTDGINVPKTFIGGEIISTEYQLTLARNLKVTSRDMRSRWGQVFFINYKESIGGNLKVRSMLSAQLISLFPGLIKHHSLRITLANQIQGRGDYTFTSPISYIRGFHNTFNYNEFGKISADYKLPLLYPDWRIGPFVYLMRIKGNIFYDVGLGRNATGNVNYQAAGVEITSDMHLLNFLAPIDLGFRYFYLPRYSVSGFELLFDINFNGI